MTKQKLILLSVLSGILFVPAWYSWGSGLILFFAFIPLLFIEDYLVKTKTNSSSFFWLPFLSFFIFNLLTSWWIKNASFAGLIIALLLNSSLMSLAFWLFSVTRRKLGNGFGYFSLIFYWIAYEYLYINGEISWTWLNLGNGFANNIHLIQWYEFTGVPGGTFWVLMINILLFKLIKTYIETKSLRTVRFEWILTLILLVFPISLSLIQYSTYQENGKSYEIVVIQPNIDPYQKFNDIPPEVQMRYLLQIADSLGTKNTDYFVAPETFINNDVWERNINSHSEIRKIRRFIEKYPKSKFVIGVTTRKMYLREEDKTETARQFRDYYYDTFNSAIQIDTSQIIPIYHKSQLVVGVEKMPYTQYLGFLQKIMLHLGGTFRSHGTQDYRDSFISPQDSIKVGPIICYESIFGEFVTDYVSDAHSNLLFVITNDGWWGDTPGYVQHNSFSSLRAIETRRSIARSANTGISSLINQRGDILQRIEWWQRSGIRGELKANDKITFYVKHGDYIGRIAVFFGILMLLYTLVATLLKKKPN
jgi:apolipoprotein N-acyltransferase